MILLKRENRIPGLFGKIAKEPYLIINLILAGVILMVIAYSGIFSPYKDNYPVVCFHKMITGKPCFSCGLSHSFSLIVRGKLSEAYTWNIYGMRVFLFFFLQFILRVFFSMKYLKNESIRPWLIRYDIAGSILLFLIAFYPFFRQLILLIVY
jgi:hypothetical protein